MVISPNSFKYYELACILFYFSRTKHNIFRIQFLQFSEMDSENYYRIFKVNPDEMEL